MQLRDFSGILPQGDATVASVEVAGVTADSRAAKSGFVFVALSGTKADGASYAADAVARGATSIVASRA